jgi:hypothetical protein
LQCTHALGSWICCKALTALGRDTEAEALRARYGLGRNS